MADGDTLFLDEIGDMPLELQPKLLGVPQEREFARLGSAQTVRVNVRVAATNQDLGQLVPLTEVFVANSPPVSIRSPIRFPTTWWRF